MSVSYPPLKNVAHTFYVTLVSQANPNILQANPTLAAGDVKVSIDGAAFANLGSLPTVAPAAGKQVSVVMAQAEMNGNKIGILFSDAAGAEWCDLYIELETSVRQIDDLATPTNITAGTIATVTNGVTVAAGGIISGAHAAAELNNIADGNLDRIMSVGTDSGADNTTARTVRQALRVLRNKYAIAAGTGTCFKEDDVTASFTETIATTAGNPVSSKDPV